jgi:hypothetical protein
LEWTQRLPEYNEADRPILRKLRCGFAMRKQQYKLNGVEFELTEIVDEDGSQKRHLQLGTSSPSGHFVDEVANLTLLPSRA